MPGIIVGCDANQEWLLPWWWSHYSKCNTYPVVFIDFGMTSEGIVYCQQRGTCIPLGAIPLSAKPIRSLKKRTLWEQQYSPALWRQRMIWFKKPFALLISPFPFSLWLDLDCRFRSHWNPYSTAWRWEQALPYAESLRQSRNCTNKKDSFDAMKQTRIAALSRSEMRRVSLTDGRKKLSCITIDMFASNRLFPGLCY